MGKMSRKGKLKTAGIIIFFAVAITLYVVKEFPGEDPDDLYKTSLTYNNTPVAQEKNTKDTKILFDYNGKTYCILGDSLYSDDNQKLAVLGKLPEGFFIDDHYLYYTYGPERRMKMFSITVEKFNYYKRYKFARYDFETAAVEPVDRQQYLELYNSVVKEG